MITTKENSVNESWLGRQKIMRILAVWLIITLIVTIMLFTASRMSAYAVANQRQITKKTIECEKLAKQMQSGSDILTNAVWRFAATGNLVYAREYIEEQEVTRSRDKAIEALRKEGLSVDELKMMERAKEVSDQLMVRELHSMKLICEADGIQDQPDTIQEVIISEGESGLTSAEQRRSAMEYVFGSEYEETKKSIEENIDSFTDSMNERQDKELREAMTRTDNSQNFQQVTAVLLLIW